MLDSFKYILFSTKKIELYDIRYPSLKVSEFPLNVNYKGMEIKNILKIDELDTDTFYIGMDQSRKDCSHLLFRTVDDNRMEFFNDFIDVHMISQSKEAVEIHDSCSILVDKDSYINFTIDNFGKLNGLTYNLKNSVDCTKNNIDLIQNNFASNINNGELASNDDKIIQIFETNYKNNSFKINKNKKDIIKYKSVNEINEADDDIILSDLSESEDSEDKIDFGIAKVNGNKQKLYKIQNKRKLVEEIINTIGKNENNEDEELIKEYSNLCVNSQNDEKELHHIDYPEELKWLFDKFDEEINK
jgi:hypothetical protein